MKNFPKALNLSCRSYAQAERSGHGTFSSRIEIKIARNTLETYENRA